MDWSKTKTIFIVTFLLLNIFLGYQLYERNKQGEISVLTDPDLQSRLEEEGIEIDIEDAEETVTGAPVTGTSATFDESYLEENLERQTISLLNSTTAYSELHGPFRLVGANLSATVDAFLQQHVYLGEEYEIAQYNESESFIGLYQTYNGLKIDEYERENFHLVLHLTEDLEIESYVQTYMEISEQEGREQDLLSPLKAVERLLDGGYLSANAVIEHAELGYYSLIQPDDNFQVFAPVWRIRVDNEDFFVDALNGEIQSIS
jgi:regulatory protein YycI of two-component signal transduction system YycFG